MNASNGLRTQPMTIGQYLAVLAVLICVAVLAVAMTACADTAGGKQIRGLGFTASNPANTGSQAILGYETHTLLNGEGVVEASIMDDSGMKETGLGGAAKYRRVTRIPLNVKLPDGSLEARWMIVMESTAANETRDKTTIKTRSDGTLAEYTITGQNVDNATVQRDVVALYQANIEAAINATREQYAAIIQKLKSQEGVSKEAIDQVVPLLNAVRMALTGGAG